MSIGENFTIKIKDVAKVYIAEDGKRAEILKNISFSVNPGEFFTILGPSGCGKSTLLRIIAGMIPASRGEIIFSEKRAEENLSMIFQSFAIFPWLTVYENVDFGLKMKGAGEKERRRLVEEHLKEVGLSGFEKSYSRDLSGGMKQRVGVARALALSPEILLMDEPFSSLDAFTAEKLRDEVLRIWLKDKMTVIMVTHLIDEAVEMSDRVLVMTPRPGTVEAFIEINLPRPRNKRSPEFFALVDKIKEVVKL